MLKTTSFLISWGKGPSFWISTDLITRYTCFQVRSTGKDRFITHKVYLIVEHTAFKSCNFATIWWWWALFFVLLDFLDQENNLWPAIQKPALKLAILVSDSLPSSILSIFVLCKLLLVQERSQHWETGFFSFLSEQCWFLLAVLLLKDIFRNRIQQWALHQFTIMNDGRFEMSLKPS